jgi:hypothetical protein
VALIEWKALRPSDKRKMQKTFLETHSCLGEQGDTRVCRTILGPMEDFCSPSAITWWGICRDNCLRLQLSQLGFTRDTHTEP